MNVAHADERVSLPPIPSLFLNSTDGDETDLTFDLIEMVDAADSISRASFSSKKSYSSAGKWPQTDDKSFTRDSVAIPAKIFRFAEDVWGKIKCTTSKTPEPIFLDDVPLRWYSVAEFAAIRDEVRRSAQLTLQSDFHFHFMRIYDQCDREEKGEELFVADVEDSAGFVAASQFRGLELTLYTKEMRRENSVVAWSVLDAQTIMVDCLAKTEKRAKVIAAVSRKLTERSRRTAFILGVGDMIAAERILDSELKIE
jgi:hypothetical protein